MRSRLKGILSCFINHPAKQGTILIPLLTWKFIYAFCRPETTKLKPLVRKRGEVKNHNLLILTLASTLALASLTSFTHYHFPYLSTKPPFMTANINQYRQWIDQLLAEGQTVKGTGSNCKETWNPLKEIIQATPVTTAWQRIRNLKKNIPRQWYPLYRRTTIFL